MMGLLTCLICDLGLTISHDGRYVEASQSALKGLVFAGILEPFVPSPKLAIT